MQVLQDQWQRFLDTNQTRKTLGSASAGQQADFGLWKTKLDFRIVVRCDPVMTGQSHFETAAQGETVQRNRNRFATGFEFAKRLIEGKAALKLLGFDFRLRHFGFWLSAAGLFVHFAEVCPRAKA